MKIIRSLNPKKAHGWDEISIRMIKLSDVALATPLNISDMVMCELRVAFIVRVTSCELHIKYELRVTSGTCYTSCELRVIWKLRVASYMDVASWNIESASCSNFAK